jgi:hypothetical protein
VYNPDHSGTPCCEVVMEFSKARLVLEFIKILIWPVFVLFVLILFRSEISMAIRTKTATVSMAGVMVAFGTGSQQAEQSATGSAPSDWLNFRPVNISQHDCINMAETVLKNTGFSQFGKDEEVSVSGNSEGYHGTIWCIPELRSVFFSVAGPNGDSARKKSDVLVKALEAEQKRNE